MFDTPVLFLVFNRPDTTKQVFEAIRQIKPKQLFVAADGPRPDKEGEMEKCEAVRKIATSIDWECELKILFREENLGCGKNISSAITWFFTHVEQGIILEDDCLPSKSFFFFCESMLNKYKEDITIGQINGSNFLQKNKIRGASYHYSIYPMIWGWATWRRAWKDYEYNLESYSNMKNDPEFWSILNTKDEVLYWKEIFNIMAISDSKNKPLIDTWDYQWIFSCWKKKYYSITPNVNLITNIGVGTDATHTQSESLVSNLKNYEIETILHPLRFQINKKADTRLFTVYFSPPDRLINKIRNIAYRVLPTGTLAFLKKLRRKVLPNLK